MSSALADVGTGDENRALGGMWAVIATVFVFRQTVAGIDASLLSRLVATVVGVALCLAYLAVFPFSPVGLSVLLALGTLAAHAIGRAQDASTIGVTVAVVMVVASLGPEADAWEQPLFRLADTVVGGLVGAAFAMVTVRLTARLEGAVGGPS
jgi:uncharacterized membrane protein YccC